MRQEGRLLHFLRRSSFTETFEQSLQCLKNKKEHGGKTGGYGEKVRRFGQPEPHHLRFLRSSVLTQFACLFESLMGNCSPKKKPAEAGWSSLIQNGFYLGAAAKPCGPAVVEILVGGWRRVLLISATAGSPADLRIRDGNVTRTLISNTCRVLVFLPRLPAGHLCVYEQVVTSGFLFARRFNLPRPG